MSARGRRRVRAMLAGLILLCPSLIGSQSRIEVFRLQAGSPLTTDGAAIFAVADDGRTVLVSSGSAADWKVLARRPTAHRISGLAADRGVLYLSDDEARAVYRLRLNAAGTASDSGRGPDGRMAEVIHEGPPFQKPRDLAFSGALLVADAGAGSVFRVDPAEGRVDVLASGLPAGEMFLTADRRGVAIALPASGEVRQPASFEGRSILQRGPAAVSFAVWRTRRPEDPVPVGMPAPTVVPQRRFPAIERPTAPLFARGSLYLVDEASGSVYVTFRQQARPMPVAPATPVVRPSRLLAIGESLLVLDGARGVLDRWPLPVPTEIDLGRDVAKALDAVYVYLYDARILPARKAAWRGSVEATLTQEGVLRGSAPAPGLSAVVCGLNAPQCASGTWRPVTSPTILVPDVPIESVVDLETLEVEELGDKTLGDAVDQRIVTPVFHDYRNDRELWELNASSLVGLNAKSARQTGKPQWGPYDAQRLRALRRSDFPPGFSLTVPTEKVRALAALPRNLLRDDERLSAIRLLSPGFNWNPLEEVEAKAYSMQPPPVTPLGPGASPSAPASPSPCPLALLRQQHEDLLKTISYVVPANLGAVNVGVIEQAVIDVQHPAFGSGHQAFAFLPAQPAPPPAAASPGPPACKDHLPEEDHATAVADLIASRDTALGLGGLAPHVQIVPVRSTDEFVGDDLFSAFRDRKVRIFNLSAHYSEKLPTNIRQKVNQMKEALFVVAAGNDATDQKPVCESVRPYPAYPVCEGNRHNVLVVAATNPDGIALIEKTTTPPAPGSNWNERLVHIAAPGTGYYAAGRDNTYVPVRGTSFATPLVTATAAVLFAEGVKDPWSIKQRIIATADQRDSLLNKVFGAGLLDVERAVRAPGHAVLGTTTPPTLVDLEPGDITIKWPGGSRTLPLVNVRRLTRNPTGQSYRIVYLDDVTDSLIIQDEVDPGPWPFTYRRVDAGGNPAGNVVPDQLTNYRDYVGPIL